MLIFLQKQFYHLLLLLFVLSLVGGSIFLDFKVFGVQFYAYRLIVLFGLAYFLFTKKLVLYRSTYSKYVFWFFSFWLLYGACSLYWCPDRVQGFKELIYIFIGFSTYLFLLSLKERVHKFEEKFAGSWMFVFFIIVVFSINEIITKSHFTSSFTESIEKFGEAHKINSVPVFTFDNPNHFAIYLCITIILSVYLIFKRVKPQWNAFAIICCLFLLSYMESRFSQLFIVFLTGLILYYKRTLFSNWRFYKYLKWGSIGLGVLLLVGVAVIFIGRGQASETANKVDPGTYSIFIDANENFNPLDSTSLDAREVNGICLAIAVKVDQRIVLKQEQVKTKYVDLKKYQKGDLLLFESYPFLKKISFPITIALLAIGIVLIIRKKKKNGFVLVVFSGFIGLFLVGIFSRHPFERVNEKWSRFVIMENQDQRRIDSTARDLITQENSIKIVSIQNTTAQKYMNGESLTLKKIDIPIILIEGKESDAIRKHLTLNGLYFLKNSHFLGVGAGGYATLIQRGEGKYDVGTVDSPHSLIIEMVSQYGVLITLFFICLLIYPFIFLFNEFRRKNRNHLILTALLVCFVIMGNSNSTSFPLPIIWVNFTLIILFFNKLASAKEKKHDSTN